MTYKNHMQQEFSGNNAREVGIQRMVMLDDCGIKLLQLAIARAAEINLCNRKNTIVSICGGSCTGKSTQVAAVLKEYFGTDAQVLSQDNYMFASVNKPLDPVYQWDHPDLYNLKESAEVMSVLKNGFRCSMPEHSTQRKQSDRIDIEPSRIVLFEGLYAAFEFLRCHADIVIYVEMPLYARIVRRLIRNLYERYRTINPQNILESFLMSPVKAHGDFVIQQRASADFVIASPYSFADSIRRFNLRPISTQAISCTRKRIFQFRLEDGFSFEIERVSHEFYFSVRHGNLIYFYFPVGEETFTRVMTLDMMSL